MPCVSCPGCYPPESKPQNDVLCGTHFAFCLGHILSPPSIKYICRSTPCSPASNLACYMFEAERTDSTVAVSPSQCSANVKWTSVTTKYAAKSPTCSVQRTLFLEFFPVPLFEPSSLLLTHGTVLPRLQGAGGAMMWHVSWSIGGLILLAASLGPYVLYYSASDTASLSPLQQKWRAMGRHLSHTIKDGNDR